MNEQRQDTQREQEPRPGADAPGSATDGGSRRTREAQRLGDGSPAVEPRRPEGEESGGQERSAPTGDDR